MNIITRRHFLITASAFLPLLPASLEAEETASAAQPPWVTMGADGILRYRADARGNRIPDFSMVGYRTGSVPLPGTPGGENVPVKATLEPAAGDQTASIQAALDGLAKLPLAANGFRGTLLLKKGTYEVSEPLLIAASGIVLRGEGQDLKSGTVIVSTTKKKVPVIRIGGSSKPVVSPATAKVTDEYVPVGSNVLHLDNADGFAVGDTVMVTRGQTEAWIKFLAADRPGIDWPVTFPQIRFDRVITSVSGNTVQVDSPITTALEARFGGATVAKYSWPARIEQCGVVNLTAKCTFTKPDDEDHATDGIEIAAARDVFVSNFTGMHFTYSAVHITPLAKWVTVTDSRCLDPVSIITGARRYSFCIDGQLCLVRRCQTRKGRHDFVANNYGVSGPNVFLDCKAENAISESGPHRHWSNGMLYDNVSTSDRISFYQRKNYGRSKDAKPPYHLGHGWAAANCVLWNCTVEKLLLVESPPGAHNWAIGCKAGSFSSSGPERGGKRDAGEFESNNQPVAIRSLYEAQLAERMKKLKPR